MADDTTVEVKIIGNLDQSVQQSTDAAKAAMDDLVARNKAISATLTALGGNTTKVTEEMLGLGSASTSAASAAEKIAASATLASAANETMAAASHINAGAIRELIVEAHELVSGNFSRMPGSLMVLAQRMGGVTLATLGWAAATAATVGGLVYLEYESLVAQQELDRLQEAFMLTGRSADFTRENIQYNLDLFRELPNVSRAAADGFMQFVAAHAQISSALANETGQLLPAFVNWGDKAGQVVGELALKLSDLSVDGFRKLDTELLNLSPTQYETIENLIKTGDTAQAVSAILADLSKNSGVYIKSLGDQVYDIETEMKQLKDVISVEGLVGGDVAGDLVKLHALETALANVRKQEAQQGQQGADSRYKALLKDAETLNEGLDKQGQITQQITKYQEALNDAKKRGDTAGASQFTSAIEAEQQKLLDLQTADNQKSYRSFLSSEDAKAAAFKAGAAQRIQIAQDEVSKAGTLFGKESQEYNAAQEKLNSERRSAADQAAELAKQKAQKEAEAQKAADRQILQDITQTAAEVRRIQAQDLDSDLAISKMRLAAQKEELEQEVADHRITAAQKFSILEDLMQKEAMLEVQRLQADMRSGQLSISAYNADANRIKQIWAKLELDIARLDRQAANENSLIWKQSVRQIENSFNNSLNGMLTGTMTWQQGVQGVVQGVLNAFLQAGEQIAENWLETQIANLFVTETTQSASASGQILSNAAVAASGAYAATAAIPYVGPMLAPAAAATAFEGASAWLAVASFDVGTANVNRDMLANIHAGEMIIPKDFSDSLRAGELVLGGGEWMLGDRFSSLTNHASQPQEMQVNVSHEAGGSVAAGGRTGSPNINFHIKAWDGGSVQKMVTNRQFQRKLTKVVGKTMTLNPSSRGAY